MKTIDLTQGLHTIVDDADFDKLNQYKWYALRQGNTFYAVRNTYRNDKRTSERMHRTILGLYSEAVEVDHMNGDGLDNRRENLRVATHAENQRNRNGWPDSSSKFKGVSWDKTRSKWIAVIGTGRTTKNLGRFDDELSAARAYDTEAINRFGEFARLNLPPE